MARTSKSMTDATSATSLAGDTLILEQSPIHLLHRAGQCAGDIFQSEMTEGDLTPRQLAVLTSVAQNEGLSQTNLVTMTGIDRSTLADIVRRMLKKGFLKRNRAKQDARAYSVKLTDDGRRVLRIAEPIAVQIDNRILSALPQSARKKFMQDLALIVDELSNVQARNSAAREAQAKT